MLTDRKFSNISKSILKKVFGLDVDALATEEMELRQQLDAVSRQVAELDDKYRAEMVSHDETKAVVDRQSRHITQLSADVKTFQLASENYQREIASLEEKFLDKEYELKNLQEARVVDLAAIASYQRELTDALTQLESIRKELSIRESTLRSNAKLIGEYKENHKKNLTELDICKKTLEEEVSNSKSLLKQLCNSANDLSVAKRELEEKQTELDKLTATLASLSEWLSRREEVEGEFQHLRGQLAAAQTKIEHLTEECNQLRLSAKEDKLRNDSQTKDLVEKLNVADSEKQKLREQLAALQSELQEASKQLDNSRQDLSSIEPTFVGDERLTEEYKVKLEKTLAELDACKKSLEEEVVNNRSYLTRLSNCENDLSSTKQILKEKQTELDTLTATLVSLSEWSCRRDEVEDEIQLLKRQLADVQKETEQQTEKYDQLLQSSIDEKLKDDERLKDLAGKLNVAEFELQRLNDQLFASQKEVKHLTEVRDQLQLSLQEKKPESSSPVKVLVEKLNDAESVIQMLNEKLVGLQADNKLFSESAKIQRNKANSDIAKLNAILLDRDNTIVELKAKIAFLEQQLKEKEGNEQKKTPTAKVIDTPKVEPSDTDVTQKPQGKPTTGHTKPVKKDDPEGEGAGDGELSDADLPTLVPYSSVETKRIIQQVVDYWTNEIIDADAFFQKPNDEIMSVSRRLEAIAKTNDTPYLLCAKCHKPVKISKIATKHGETKFFTHCTNDVVCVWRHNDDLPFPPPTPPTKIDVPKISIGVSRYNKLKSLIIEALKEQKKTDHRIMSDVAKDIVVSGVGNRQWRRADVYMMWNGKKVIFKLQRDADGSRFLQAYDAFCQSNGIYVIWIFGCESGNQYQYLLEHNYQFTFFDNKTCVFIIDNEAEQKTKQSGKLYLKCNWLVDGIHWRFTQANSGSNGLLVSLDDLTFDEKGNFKPYYNEMDSMAVWDTEKLVMLKENVYKYAEGALWGLYNQKENIKTRCKYRTIELGDDGLIHAETADYLHPRKGILSDMGEEMESSREPLNDNIFLVCNFDRWFLVSEDGGYITKDYESLVLWNDDRLIAKDEKGFSVIDFEENDVTGKKYLSFDILSPTKARVTDYEGTYEIDCDGNIMSYTVVNLHDGFSKVCHLRKWGIKDKSGKLIVDCVYHEIVSFRRRFYGFTDNGLIKLSKAPEYAYRIPFRATFKKMWGNDYLFDFMGNALYMPDNAFNHVERKANTEYDVFLLNIERYEDGTNVINIAAAQKNTPNQMFSHIDKDTDFRQGEVLIGKVTMAKPNRLYIEFDDGRKTYVSTNRIRKHGFKSQRFPVGATIKLEKIDFEPFYESTVWKVLG